MLNKVIVALLFILTILLLVYASPTFINCLEEYL